jgi:hypothetical protein
MNQTLKLAVLIFAATSLSACGQSPSSSGAPAADTTTALPVATAQAMLNEAISLCASVKAQVATAQSLASGAAVSGVVNGYYKGQNVASVKDAKGNFMFLGTAPGAKVELVSNLEGNVVICDASLTAVSGTNKGNFMIVNGNVGNVTGLVGNVVIQNGSLTGQVKTSKAIVVTNDSSGRLSSSIVNN